MGIFDDIMKKANDALSSKEVKEAKQKIGDMSNNIKQKVETEIKARIPQKYNVPDKYSMFPLYPSTLIYNPVEKDTEKYNRISCLYELTISKEEYEDMLIKAGFIKNSNVRFDRYNTYVIIEDISQRARIVYHIKK